MKNQSQYADRQTAFNYVIYMIVGSYFRSARCRDRAREGRMHFHYREMKEREQIRMEDVCIRYAEKVLLGLPKHFWEEDVEVRFVRNDCGDDTLVCFAGKGFVLAVGGRYAGGRTRLAHRVMRRRGARGRLGRRKAA